MRKKCKRKVWPLVNPITHAMEGAAMTSTEKLDAVRIRELSAIESFRIGHGTRHDWDYLCDMCNASETMVDMGIVPEALEPKIAAHKALVQIRERFNRTQKFGVTGPELEALREAFRWHDAQRTQIHQSKYEEALRLTINRIRSAHPSVKVYA